LYELTPLGRVAMDSTLALLILGTITAVRFRFLRAAHAEVAEERLQRLLTWGVIVAAFLAGTTLIRQTRLMWDDFLMVIGVLLLHPVVEQALHWAMPRLCALLPRAWRRVALEEEE